MLKNRNIICISSIDWDFIWQGHQEIMSNLAKNDNRVLFIENTGARSPGVRDFGRIKKRIKNWFSGIGGIRKQDNNLYIYSPLVLPFPYLKIANFINSRIVMSVLNKWVKAMDFSDPIIWVFLPTPLTMKIVNNFNYKIVVYYCIDNFRVSSKFAKKIVDSEINLLKNADLVFVTSHELYNYSLQFNKKVYLFPFAVDYEYFEKARSGVLNVPDDLRQIKHPIVGYVGGLHRWLDLKLIKQAALLMPEYSFVFIGPAQTDLQELSNIRNIYFLGKKDHKSLPAYINCFDACIIPYLLTEYTKNVYPTKLNEYMAMGKAVISTDIPEVRYFNKENDNIIFVANKPEDFCDKIKSAIAVNSQADFNKRIAVAKKNSWKQRINQMTALISVAIDEADKKRHDWKDNFLKIYNRTKRNFIKSALLSGALYILIFYTPLMWFLADPLKISEAPVKSDAIVVLAGGVGETGLAGYSYEERVKYAIELYKQGYADHLVFSSGFVYIFNEPLVMKALAISLGVPEEAIILESASKNTYEHVTNIKKLLSENKMSNIIVVSSPYHMRRLYLVSKKLAGNINFTYCPVPSSIFYMRRINNPAENTLQQVNLAQIKAFIHEYSAIVYYWFKGWI
ncbi:MAG: glycosyltransferase [Candidatus Omnitrophota bacterium]|jgi:uncharacterized SAM-binding protein YcdF (DUF218 family)/glycosyltransferase involved in cell wall biosynthesis|nr:MAG: glycosyltransferase [Candidatus Omnitrophota bacterium]